MAYTQEIGDYLVPIIPLATSDAGVMQEMDIGAASADHGEMLCVRRAFVLRLKFTLVGELAGGSSVAPTVVFTKRPTPLSATAESVIGTLIIPDATAVGKTLYLDVDPVNLSVGDSVEISHTIGTGTPTGQGYWSMDLEPDPEDARNESDMIKSA